MIKYYVLFFEIGFETFFKKGRVLRVMKHIKIIAKNALSKTLVNGGCGECQASCQSACKTSCTVANQVCKSRK